MKARMVVCMLCLGIVLLPMALYAQGRGGGGKTAGGAGNGIAPYNPAPFQNFVVSPSAPVRFLLSEAGKQFLRQSDNPKHLEILRALGEEPSGLAPSTPAQPPPSGRGRSRPIPSMARNPASQPLGPSSTWNHSRAFCPRTSSRWTSSWAG